MTTTMMTMARRPTLYLRVGCLYPFGWRPNFPKNWSPPPWKTSIHIMAGKRPLLSSVKAVTSLGKYSTKYFFRSASGMPTSRSYPRHLVQFREKRKKGYQRLPMVTTGYQRLPKVTKGYHRILLYLFY